MPLERAVGLLHLHAVVQHVLLHARVRAVRVAQLRLRALLRLQLRDELLEREDGILQLVHRGGQAAKVHGEICGVHPSVVPEERTGGVPDLRNRGPHLRELVLLARARATARLAFLFARRAVEINLIRVVKYVLPGKRDELARHVRPKKRIDTFLTSSHLCNNVRNLLDLFRVIVVDDVTCTSTIVPIGRFMSCVHFKYGVYSVSCPCLRVLS